MEKSPILYFAEKDTELMIEFLEGKLNQIQLSIMKTKLLHEALEMEKELIVKSWDDGNFNYFYSKKTNIDFDNGLDYYNEIYK